MRSPRCRSSSCNTSARFWLAAPMRPLEVEEQASTRWVRRQTCSMNPLKQETTMKKKNSFLWAALSMTAALVMTACSNDDNDMTEAPVAPSTSKTIPYTVTVSGEEATTRATVDDNNKTLRFATGDKLYITGTDIQGVLDLKSGDEGKTTGATFSGTLTYSGSGSPSDGLSLTATLVSAQQTVGNQVSVDGAGAVTVNYPTYPTAAYCTSVNDAVQQYSKLTGTSTYSAKSFSLTQQTAFLNFVITFDDGTTTSGTTLSAVVSNNSSAICTADVTTTTENGNVVAKFVLPVASGTTLTSPTVTMDSKDAIRFSGAATLSPKVYNVKRIQAYPGAINGKFSVSSTKKVYFSKGNLRATTSDKGANWTWAFATNQWDKIGGRDQSGSGTPTGNNYINGNGTLSANGTVDLFGWSTSATHLGINNSTNNSTYRGVFADWGEAPEVTATIGTGWRTLTRVEWEYLLDPNAKSHRTGMQYIKAQVNGVNGLIVFPDNWSDSYHHLSSEYVNNNAISFENIKIAESTWVNDFETHGAVFLPVAGQRHVNNNYVEYPNGRGHYWSATSAGDETAYRVYFTGNSSDWSYGVGSSRRFGYAVRLVRDVTVSE